MPQKYTQSRLADVSIDKKPEKHHKFRKPKKTWLNFYEPDTPDFDGIIKKARELGRNHFIVATSGGKDSGVVLDMAHKKGILDGIFYIRTNTGVQATEDFVVQRAKDYGAKLYIREPHPHPYIYVAYCLDFGFPSSGLHSSIMNILKYKTMLKFSMEPKFRDVSMTFLGGVRKFESSRRKLNYLTPISDDSGHIWFTNPIFYETTEDVYKYYIENNVKRSPVYDYYPSSMECLCGSFANGKQEMAAVRQLDPKRAEFFEWIKEGIDKFGTPGAKKHNEWGGAKWDEKDVNMVLDHFETDEHTKNVANLICGSECGAGTLRGSENY